MCALTPLPESAADGRSQRRSGQTRAGPNGQINIPEGRFHAYGQDLIGVRVSYCSLVRQINRILISKYS